MKAFKISLQKALFFNICMHIKNTCFMTTLILLNVITGLGLFVLQSQSKHIGQICRSVNVIYSDAIFEFAKLMQKGTV